MKKIHYRNIGFPKTGTNWIWDQLGRHPQIDGRFNVQFKEFRAKNIEEYKKVYENYNITYNLDTHVFTENSILDYLSPEKIHEHTTHLTMIFRSPYDVLNSMYNMDKNRNPNFKADKKEYTEIGKKVVLYGNTEHIFDYWKRCSLPVKYMIYDDLQDDPKQFMHSICQYIGIKPFHDAKRGLVFATQKNDPLVFDNKDAIDYINRGISVIEKQLNRDLSHWKK